MAYNKEKVFAFYNDHVRGLEHAGEDRAVGFCPFHADENKKSASIMLSEGLFKCFSPACNESGNVISFARKLNITIPRWAGGKNWRRIYEMILKETRDQAFEYLLHRGIPEWYVQQLYDNKEFAQSAPNEHSDLLTVVFPIYSSSGDISGLNKISMDSSDKRVNGALEGSFWIDTNFDWEKPIIMVEGILNALSINSCELDLQALSIIASENTVIEPGILNKPTYMFDNDVAGYSVARKYARTVKCGMCVQWDARFPNKYDPNDLLMYSSNFEKDLTEVLATAEPIDEWTDAKRTLDIIKDRRTAFNWS